MSCHQDQTACVYLAFSVTSPLVKGINSSLISSFVKRIETVFFVSVLRRKAFAGMFVFTALMSWRYYHGNLGVVRYVILMK